MALIQQLEDLDLDEDSDNEAEETDDIDTIGNRLCDSFVTVHDCIEMQVLMCSICLFRCPIHSQQDEARCNCLLSGPASSATHPTEDLILTMDVSSTEAGTIL